MRSVHVSSSNARNERPDTVLGWIASVIFALITGVGAWRSHDWLVKIGCALLCIVCCTLIVVLAHDAFRRWRSNR